MGTFGGEGAPIAAFLGITDPGMSMALNGFLGPLLSTFAGGGPNGKYLPAMFSSGANMYSQMRAGSVIGNQNRAMGMASQRDQRAIYEMIEGSANLLGQPMGRRERQNANDISSYVTSMLPSIAQYNPDLVDKMAGVKGSATVMAQNMARGGRYAIDPVTGRRGYSAESAGEITKGVYDRLYAGDASAMGGMTAGRAGALFDEAQRRGMMPNSSGRGRGMKEIADQMGTTISEVSQMPDLDRKLRELDANKIASKLKGMSKAVNAMSEIFGEAGESNAPMSELVGAIETLTQANMQNMEPQKLARMVRNTSNVAKAAGIEMPEMFKLMGATAGMADRAGVNRAFVPEITSQAIAENQAGKNIFGGAQVFGLPNADKLLNIDQQLNIQATRDYRTQDVASIARAVETFGVEPEKGSELAAVYAAIKDKDSGGNYMYAGENKNVYDLNKQKGGINQFLTGNKVPISVIQSLNANREANEPFIDKYKINTNIGRPGQTGLLTDQLSMHNSVALQSVVRDEELMKDVSPELRELLKSSSQEITNRTSAGLFADNLGKEDLNDLKGLTQRNLNKIIEEKGIVTTDADKKALTVMAGSIYESSDTFAKNQQFGGLPAMAYSMNKGKIREANALKQEADITSQFEEGFDGMGKSSFLQRTTDFLRGAGKETKVEDFMAAAFNYQPKKQIEEMFAKDFADLQKSAEAFKGANGEQVKMDYLRNAITINADEISKETDPDKQKKLIAEKENLKEEAVRSNFTSRNDSDKYYDDMIDKKGGVTKAKEEQQGFESKYGITVEQARNLKPLELQVKARQFKLDKYKEMAEKLNIRMDNSGLMLGDVSGDREANEAIKYLEKGEAGSTNYGISLAKKYISNFNMDKAAVSKAGVEGNNAKEKVQSSMQSIEDYAKALGVEPGELLDEKFDAGKLPAQIDMSTLINETSRQMNGLTALNDNKENGDAFNEIRSGFKKQADILRTIQEPETSSQNASRQREIKRLDALSTTTKENLSSKMTEAKKAKEELEGEPLKALESSFKEFKATQEAQDNHANVVANFIKETNKTTEKGNLSLEQIAAPEPGELQMVRELRDEKSKITGTSPKDETARKEIDKKISTVIADSGMDESKFKGLAGKDYDDATAILEKYDGNLNGEQQQKLEKLKKLIGPQNPLTKEEKNKLDALNTDSVNSKDLRLNELQTRKARADHGEEAVTFSGTKGAQYTKETSAIFNKYKSAYDLTSSHDPLSEKGKAKKVERERILELAGITTKDIEEQNTQLELMFDKQKAVEAGIKYGESFVIDDKGQARRATDDEVASGNFSYINKSGNTVTQGRQSHYGFEKPKAGTYDKFKNKDTTPLTDEEEKERSNLLTKQNDEHKDLKAKKEAYDKTLTEPDRIEYERLLAKRDSTYSPEDRKKLDEYATKAGMTFEGLKGLKVFQKDSEEIIKGLSEEDRVIAKDLIKKGKVLNAQQIAATMKLDNVAPATVLALLGTKGFNDLVTSKKRQLISSLKDLGVATTVGGKTALSSSQKEAIEKASALQSGTTQTAVKYFADDLKLPGMSKKQGETVGTLEAEVLAHEGAARDVGASLAIGLDVAGRAAAPKGSTAPITRTEQMTALGKLLSSTDDKGLSEEQKNLKEGMIKKGFKDVVDSKGKVDEAKLIELFKKTETTIAEKNALDPSKGQEGKNQVTAVFEKGQEFVVKGTLNLESKLLTADMIPSSTSSA